MAKRNDIKSIMIIGAGPIIIGQACEFDYSGTQACKALREEGYRIILINSNPATIMTDKNLADATYIEPITIDAIEAIIKKEKPDALLPTVGGQTALDAAVQLERKGVLNKYNVELIGANIDAIEQAVPGNRIGDISHAVQTRAESHGYGVVRELVGHGIGTNLHEEPQIPNYGLPGKGPRIEVGMCFAIEPMINMGAPDVYTKKDGWTICTKDGLPSAHFEHSITITKNGAIILTE